MGGPRATATGSLDANDWGKKALSALVKNLVTNIGDQRAGGSAGQSATQRSHGHIRR